MVDRLLGSVLARAPKSVLLLGPRQTGKSTLVLDLRPDMVINLARESEFLTFAANSSELEERIRAKTPVSYTHLTLPTTERV